MYYDSDSSSSDDTSDDIKEKLWNPTKVLGIINTDPGYQRITCIGYAPTQGRRCRNPINASNRAIIMETLDEIAYLQPDSHAVKSQLRAIAGPALCVRYHQNQAATVVKQWKENIKQIKPRSENRLQPRSSKGNKALEDTQKEVRELKDIVTELQDELKRQRRKSQREAREEEYAAEDREKDQRRRQRESRERMKRDEEAKREEDEREEEETAKFLAELRDIARRRQMQKLRELLKREEEAEREEDERREKERRAEEEARQEKERKAEEERQEKKRRAEEEERREKERRAEEKERERLEQKKEKERQEKEKQDREQKAREDAAQNERTREKARKKREERREKERESARKEREEWDRLWTSYQERWIAFKASSRTEENIQEVIPWPVKSGLYKDVCGSEVKIFFRMAVPREANMNLLMKKEAIKWHPDKTRMWLPGGKLAEALEDKIGEVCRVVTELK